MLYLKKLTSLALLLVASVANGQLSVDVKPVKIVQTITPHIVSQVTTESGEAIGAPVETKGTPVTKPGAPSVLLFLDTKRPIGELLVKIKCKTAEAVMIEPGVYSISKPGTHELDVNVIGQNPLTWDDETVVVTVGTGPEPEPDDDEDDEKPDDPPAPPIENDYGVGLIAFTEAPDDPVNVERFAEIYKQAGDFLFGIPSLKFIISNDQEHSQDPERSVLAWITQQYGTVVCTDEEKCKQWAKWKAEIQQALIASQLRRPYTRVDWFAALNEISKGVGTPKQ